MPGQCTFISEQAPGVLQFNAGGYPLPYSPKNSFNLGANYERVAQYLDPVTWVVLGAFVVAYVVRLARWKRSENG